MNRVKLKAVLLNNTVKCCLMTVIVTVVLSYAMLVNRQQAPHIVWSFSGGDSFEAAPIVSTDGTLFSVCLDGKVYALNSVTGKLNWTYSVGDPLFYTPVLLGLNVYTTANSDKVCALNQRNGKAVWAYVARTTVDASPATDKKSRLFVSAGELVALDATRGHELWTFEGRGYPAQPVIDGHEIACSGQTVYWDNFSAVYGIDSLNGKQRWMHVHPGRVCIVAGGGSTPAGYVTMCYEYIAGYTSGYLVALSGVSGTQLWSVPVTGRPRTVVSPAGVIYALTSDGNVMAINAKTGSVNWSRKLTSRASAPPSLSPIGDVYVTGADDTVWLLNSRTGATKWDFKLDANAYYYDAGMGVSSVTAGLNDRIYVASSDEKLYCFGSDSRKTWGIAKL